MSLRNVLLGLSSVPEPEAGSPQPRAEHESSNGTTVVWLPAPPEPMDTADVILIVVPVVFVTLLLAGIITIVVLKRKEKWGQDRRLCRSGQNSRQREPQNTDLEAADGSGYALIERHSSDSESDDDSDSHRLELPLFTDAHIQDGAGKGKNDLLEPPPYSER
ncbi:hypothetical protein FRC01_000520 [Tulasnella sp. 417]|nr:hypothetical protein FRC01_000520 [Tulasnella sp. 417]